MHHTPTKNHVVICSRHGLMQSAGHSSGQQGGWSEFTAEIKQWKIDLPGLKLCKPCGVFSNRRNTHIRRPGSPLTIRHPKNYGGIWIQFSAKKNLAIPTVPSHQINLLSFPKTRLNWCESRRPQQHHHQFRSRAKNISTVSSRLLRKMWKL